MFQIAYHSPIGPIYMAEEGEKITWIGFSPLTGGASFETPLLTYAKEQLSSYFAGTRREFDLPLHLKGTDFQRRVWAGLQEIPYGETWSYKDLAIAVGSPKGYRAVGLANNRNPVSIVIPCHRVIGANGKLVGYGGGLNKKEILLDLEKTMN